MRSLLGSVAPHPRQRRSPPVLVRRLPQRASHRHLVEQPTLVSAAAGGRGRDRGHLCTYFGVEGGDAAILTCPDGHPVYSYLFGLTPPAAGSHGRHNRHLSLCVSGVPRRQRTATAVPFDGSCLHQCASYLSLHTLLPTAGRCGCLRGHLCTVLAAASRAAARQSLRHILSHLVAHCRILSCRPSGLSLCLQLVDAGVILDTVKLCASGAESGSTQPRPDPARRHPPI